MLTLAIFTEMFRRTIGAWRYHGFFPKAKESSAQNQQAKQQGDKIRNYHAQIRAMLRSVTSADARLRDVPLPIGPNGTAMQVDIIVCILYVIQDIQEGDTLCGRFGPQTSKIQRQCRPCDINYDKLGG